MCPSRSRSACFNWATPRRGWKRYALLKEYYGARELQLGHPPEGMEAPTTVNKIGSETGELQLGHPPGWDGSVLSLEMATGVSSASIRPPPGGMEAAPVASGPVPDI